MVADFMTKPLQGATFQKFRDAIMGIKPFNTDNEVSNKSDDAVGKSKPTATSAMKSRSIKNVWHIIRTCATGVCWEM